MISRTAGKFFVLSIHDDNFGNFSLSNSYPENSFKEGNRSNLKNYCMKIVKNLVKKLINLPWPDHVINHGFLLASKEIAIQILFEVF